VREQSRTHARGTGELSTVTGLSLNVADRDSFRNLGQRERVPRFDIGSNTDLDFFADRDSLGGKN
jgi:hypothetical protein